MVSGIYNLISFSSNKIHRHFSHIIDWKLNGLPKVFHFSICITCTTFIRWWINWFFSKFLKCKNAIWNIIFMWFFPDDNFLNRFKCSINIILGNKFLLFWCFLYQCKFMVIRLLSFWSQWELNWVLSSTIQTDIPFSLSLYNFIRRKLTKVIYWLRSHN